jgi:hypothetical protein
MALALGLGWLAGVADAAAGSAPRPASRGPALSAGLGSLYAGAGLQAHYFLPVAGTRWSWTPSLGLGYVPNLYPPDWVLDPATQFGFAAAVSVSYGYRHRLSANLGYGLVGTVGVPVQNIFIEADPLYGMALEAGYEFVGTSGFLFRFCPFGLSYWTHRLLAAGERWHWSVTLGLGWKLW